MKYLFILISILIIGCNDSQKQKEEQSSIGVHFPDLYEQALSFDPSISVPAVSKLIENNKTSFIELVWLKGNNSSTRLLALKHLLKTPKENKERLKSVIETISSEKMIRINEIEQTKSNK